MNKTKRLFTLLLLVCGMTTGAWAQSSDVLSGEFTINASGDKVHFSKGNLQYINGNWQFAEHQYDYIGDNQSDNNKDLFAFNGYSTPDASWFNMSHDQWKYLLATRSVTNSLYAGARYTMATLGGTYKGLIIFPDDYTHPDGTDFVAGIYNSYSNFTATVSLAGWALMEAAGCVFLPAAGFYSAPNEKFGGFGEAVEINTTTSSGSNYYTPAFKLDLADSDATSNKNSRMSVRLVQLKTDLQKDADDYYLIGTVQDWKNFAAIVNNEINTAANARMIADIDLGDDQTYISPTWHGEFSSQHYHGTFDGQGHTLTVHYNSSNNFHTPFSQTSGATIKNLHVAGTIKSTSSDPSHMSGLVSNSAGSDVIQNIWVSADITGGSHSWIECGAFVGCNNCGNTTITDCLFTGSITTTGGNNGCFAGYNQGYQNSTITTNNCLSTGTFNFTSGGVSVGTINNSYVKSYPKSIPAAMQLTAEQLADGTITYKLQNNRGDLVWGQRIGTDAEPVLTNDESYRVYRSINGGYTNDPTLAYEGLQKDVNDNYLLGCVWDWQDFAALVNGGTTNINAKMTADIDLGDDQTTMGPTEALAYKGTFDGQGYTLTVNISSTADICAPFRYVGDGAVIKNLHIAGTVNGAHRRIGGLVGEGKGTYSINNCISSVTINTTYNGDGIQGGFVASQRGTLQISDCIFDGEFYGPNAYTWGGIVGWKYNTTSISNCLVLCDSYNVKMTDVATFIPNDNNITNCYYKTAIGTAQGRQASAEQLADGTVAYRLQAGRTDMFWGQRIGTDTEPVLTNDESYRVYRSINGGYTNDPTLAYEGLQKDVNDNYLLGCVWDWQDFAALVNGGTTNINARMTADIDLGDDQTMIGDTGESTSSPCFSGIFDGQGYTLTVAYTGIGSSSVGAPFAKINGATIKNLHVKGSLSSAGYHPTSIVSDSWGTSRLEKVWGEVDITGTRTGWVEASGLVGCMKAGNLTIEDCLFTGTVNGSGSYNGCFIGYIDSGSATITNSLSTGTFSYSGESNGFRGTHTNCYVKQFPTSYPSGVTKPTDEELADGTTTTALNNGRSEVIWVQDVLTNQPQLAIFANKYTVPSSGIGTFSAKAKFAVPEGLTAHYCKTYNSEARTISVANIDGAVPANTGVLLKGTPGETYTLTGTNSEAATVTDNVLVAVTEQTDITQTADINNVNYTNFGLSGGVFKKVNANGGTVKANRAYLQLPTSALTSVAYALGISLVWDENVTSIQEVQGSTFNVQGDGVWFTLDGRRLNGKPTTEGLYIVNGKKVVISLK